MHLDKFGVFSTGARFADDQLGEAAALAERLGFGAFWRGGSPPPSVLTAVLEATSSLVAATGIVNVWKTEPSVAAEQHAQLHERFGDRVLLGIGIGHPESTAEYRRPLPMMREYLDGLDNASRPVPTDQRCIGALGPKMLDLSKERSLGTHPYFVPVAHTRAARQRLGEGPLLAPSLACVVDTDEQRGRAAGREYAAMYLRLGNYTNNLLRHGYSEDDIADGGSARLIDEVVPHGTAEQIAAVARAHIDAGADHVCLQVVDVKGQVPAEQWTALAAALGL